jgi:hypothetical protein
LQGAKSELKAYSHGNIALKRFAPAIAQSLALDLITDMTQLGMKAIFLRTLAFRSFQSSQAVRRSNNVSPFYRLPLAQESAHHYPSRESKFAQDWKNPLGQVNP